MLKNKSIKELQEIKKTIEHLHTLVGKTPLIFMEQSKYPCYFESDSITVLYEKLEIYAWIDQSKVSGLCFKDGEYFDLKDLN